MGTMTTPKSQATTFSTQWVPRMIRCARCGELAHEEFRERLDDDDVAVRYGCNACRWHSTRHFHESDVVKALESA